MLVLVVVHQRVLVFLRIHANVKMVGQDQIAQFLFALVVHKLIHYLALVPPRVLVFQRAVVHVKLVGQVSIVPFQFVMV